MPIASSSSTESGQEALETIIDHLDMVNSTNGLPEMDLLFLKEVMQGKLLQNLVKAHDTLEEQQELLPCHSDSVGYASDVIAELTSVLGTDDDAAELAGILQDLHFISLLQTHDDIASGNMGQTESYLDPKQAQDTSYDFGDSIKMVGIRKVKDQPLSPLTDPYLSSDPIVIVSMIRPKDTPLGITVRCDGGELVVARVLHGGIIDQQGLLHVGDIIKEINDVDITNDPEAFHQQLAQSNGRVILKILPSYFDMLPPPPPIYLRAFFDYKPPKDALLPCGDVGLAFDKGDVLCVVDRSDPDWWQALASLLDKCGFEKLTIPPSCTGGYCLIQDLRAYIVGKEGTCGLIPSEELEERRRAFVPSDHLHTKRVACGLIKTKKKKKSSYETRKNYQFDKSDIISYEEVQEMPPFHRKTLILIGAQGVGRRVIVNQLIRSDSDRFGCAVPSTSRRMKEGEEDGVSYNFVSRKDLEDDIINNQLLEYGEFMGNIYGTAFDAIRKVNKENKICILDVNPQTLKLLRNSEFLPFVVFVKSPSLDMLRAMHQHASRGTGTVPDSDLQKTVDESARIEQLYSHLFDFTIVNNHLEETCEEILFELENLETNRQWVPVTWVYDCP